ncbi:hypothetical protein AB6C64_13730 [Vibrio cyclitrophicus]
MRFGLAITLFSPNETEIKRISDIAPLFEAIIAYDNTEGRIESRYIELLETAGVTVLSNGLNDGLSKAYNDMSYYLINRQIDYSLILDQDSKFDACSIDKFMRRVEVIGEPSVGVYCPTILYEHDISVIKERKNNTMSFEDVDWCISSGSLINLAVLSKVKGFDEAYFIDRIDSDYCTVLKKSGYGIVRINDVFMQQSLGAIKHVFWFSIFEHSCLRNYYIARNRVYFYHKHYPNLIERYFKIIFLSLRHVLRVIFLENNKISKIKMILLGITDAINKDFGKIRIKVK